MKTLLQKLLPLFLILCFLSGCEKDSKYYLDHPITEFTSYPADSDPAGYATINFDLTPDVTVTNKRGKSLRWNPDYEGGGGMYLFGDMELYYCFSLGGSNCSIPISLEVLASEYYIFEYFTDPGNHLSVSTETDHLIVEASEIEKAVLYTSRSPGAVCAALDGDLSEFSVRCYLYGEHRQLILTGSGKNHVEVRYENGTLVAEGEGLEYSVTEEAA